MTGPMVATVAPSVFFRAIATQVIALNSHVVNSRTLQQKGTLPGSVWEIHKQFSYAYFLYIVFC